MIRGIWLSVLLTGLSACAQDRVVLLANPDGTSSGVVAVLDAKSGTERAILREANTEAVIGNKVTFKQLQEGEIKSRYGDLIEALPQPPALYTLYFVSGSVEVTDESRLPLAELLADVKGRPGAEVQVTGHTDTVGDGADNDALSLKRAEEVATMLIRTGVPEDLVVIAGRGEREMLVATDDNVAEVQNRRVVVTVR
jgi:OOP family OmpA-OmpF porin